MVSRGIKSTVFINAIQQKIIQSVILSVHVTRYTQRLPLAVSDYHSWQQKTDFFRKKSAVSVPSGRTSSSELDDSDSLDLSHISSLSPSDSCMHTTANIVPLTLTLLQALNCQLTFHQCHKHTTFDIRAMSLSDYWKHITPDTLPLSPSSIHSDLHK